ncbi:uncharacterized protein LOC122032347 [Zingiber officinale]|uniref:Uncharacterized protein n=1 Tax=Zingiber officinale TaxID=94328 RepID=A0A8J5CAZ9_ZINOF|nr:uncharacterized protein LOC122032347 [Zingiber officinale]KAG6469984.1 hypothetical protein ZIOFF_070923 [Zingiber officinale]
MVVALGPGRFYGSSLPRPRFFADDERVDPPVPVLDPLLSWANEAHWSMGGLSFSRHRLQGRIEGSIKKLRAQQEKIQRRAASPPPAAPTKPAISKPRAAAGKITLSLSRLDSNPSERNEGEVAVEKPQNSKAGSGVQSSTGPAEKKRKRVRRLGEEFDRIAAELLKEPKIQLRGAAARTRSRRSIGEEIEQDESEPSAPALHKKESAEKKKLKLADGGPPRRTSPRNKQ